jgi:putative transposase
MSHVFHQLYYHFAWATHSREPLIDRGWRPQLLEIINEEVKTRGGWPIRHNAMPDHAHLLCRLPPTVLIAEFIGQLKGATSFRVNKEIQPRFKLRWQEGYGVLSYERMRLGRFPGILTSRRSTTVDAPYLSYWRDTIVRKMISLKAFEIKAS